MLVGLSAFGTTAFKIDEDRKSGDVQTQVYLEPMKKYEARLTEYYLILRELLVATSDSSGDTTHLKVTQTNEKGFPVELETRGFEKNAKLELRNFDLNGIPCEF